MKTFKVGDKVMCNEGMIGGVVTIATPNWSQIRTRTGHLFEFRNSHLSLIEPASQPPPVSNDSRSIWEMVIEDMRERSEMGRVQASSGMDGLRGAYEKALDLAVYLKQAIVEKGN